MIYWTRQPTCETARLRILTWFCIFLLSFKFHSDEHDSRIFLRQIPPLIRNPHSSIKQCWNHWTRDKGYTTWSLTCTVEGVDTASVLYNIHPCHVVEYRNNRYWTRFSVSSFLSCLPETLPIALISQSSSSLLRGLGYAVYHSTTMSDPVPNDLSNDVHMTAMFISFAQLIGVISSIQDST
ncbi:hypothetical protein ASPBRDRAFT_644246 [Aspergillus brasiliensis CBS 101740]|uniref:Uncharacterized protein n=1 Tax=Aspergillus brasiliensis (strain CBS 101740 / IMI 381727 / IBT 21946) TaxID=767769 RepID=A0A1L9UE35_ASPBC|nr:hypothetical protein ASPBRDRAFT_644246 [Aspergillus brasiliensis CBS 101740]